MASPLPNYVSSLSKYYRAEAHYPLLAAIVEDIPEPKLRAKFDPDLYATGKQRYLTVHNGVVVRDKLVDLVHEEGEFTERVKMAMYFLFMFRDESYRGFICSELSKRGKWRTSIFRDTHSNYFAGRGGHKAFTNLRQFLFQTDTRDETLSQVFWGTPLM